MIAIQEKNMNCLSIWISLGLSALVFKKLSTCFRLMFKFQFIFIFLNVHAVLHNDKANSGFSGMFKYHILLSIQTLHKVFGLGFFGSYSFKYSLEWSHKLGTVFYFGSFILLLGRNIRAQWSGMGSGGKTATFRSPQRYSIEFCYRLWPLKKFHWLFLKPSLCFLGDMLWAVFFLKLEILAPA